MSPPPTWPGSEVALAPAGAGAQTAGMGWLAHHWAELPGVLLPAIIVVLQVAGSRLTPSGGPYATLMGAAWWALILWSVWYLALRLRRR